MDRYVSALCTAAALGLGAGGVQAASLTVTDISGAWSSWTGGTAVAAGAQGSTAQLRWGIPTDSNKSGYDFTPSAPPLTPAQDTDFDLGTFTHLNFPIQLNNGITGATLDVSFTFYLGSDSSNLMTRKSQFVFDHLETTNNAAPCADGGSVGEGVNANGCADRVRVVTNPSATESFEVVENGVKRNYIFAVTGFDVGDPFWTAEKAENSAVLRARYTYDESVQPAPVPVPAAGWLLLAGIGGLAAASRRRKSG